MFATAFRVVVARSPDRATGPTEGLPWLQTFGHAKCGVRRPANNAELAKRFFMCAGPLWASIYEEDHMGFFKGLTS
jgi:hypothetical protein